MMQSRPRSAPRWTAVFLMLAALSCLFVPAGMFTPIVVMLICLLRSRAVSDFLIDKNYSYGEA
jgi:hypothetical protein